MQSNGLLLVHSTCRAASHMDVGIKCNGFGTFHLAHESNQNLYAHDFFVLMQQFLQVHVGATVKHEHLDCLSLFTLLLLIFSGATFMILDISKSHFLLEWEHVWSPIVWLSTAVCGSLRVCVCVSDGFTMCTGSLHGTKWSRIWKKLSSLRYCRKASSSSSSPSSSSFCF